MVVIRPFAALRPVSELADKVAILPMGMMKSDEARALAEGNPYSFLHIDKAEIDLPEELFGVLSAADLYPDDVYQQAAENLLRFESEGTLQQDEKPMLYIYRQQMNGRSQTGLVVCAAIDDYINNNIKRHEFTRAAKEASCVKQIDKCNANTGPIFLAYQHREDISKLIADWVMANAPVYDFTTANGVIHTVWVIDDEAVVNGLTDAFASVESLYIADGHHRTASAAHVGELRRKANPEYDGSEEFNYFLATLFPADELTIMDYNRVVHDLNGLSEEEFLERMGEAFDIELCQEEGLPKPSSVHTMSMRLASGWYRLSVKDGVFDPADIMGQLDVSILQDVVLEPILGIADPRVDKRIDFVSGSRGLPELEKRVLNGWAVAFAMYPTSMDDLMAIADQGDVMPPKSTWFEPKLLSGLFIHKF